MSSPIRRGGLGTAVAATALLLATATASASVSHVFSTTFGAAGSTPANPYPLSGPTDIAVERATRDFYVTDPGNHRVEKFDSAGNFLLMIGKGVNQSSGGNLCAAGETCKAGTSASSPAGFETPAYMVVDNSSSPSKGDLYVADTASNLVQKFDSSGHIISSWGTSGQKDGSDATNLPGFGPTITGVAVDLTNGDLVVGGTHYLNCCAAINTWRYTQDGKYIEYGAPPGYGTHWLKSDPFGDLYASNGERIFWKEASLVTTGAPTTGFEFDLSSKELYQDTGLEVEHYGSDCNAISKPCEPLDAFGAGHLSGAMGVGVDPVSHSVYVANSSSNDIAVFTDARPIVKVGPPTAVEETAVTITGQIDPAGRGNITECHFEYGFDKTYGTTLPCSPDPAASPPGSNFSGPQEVTATIMGLSAGTHDHYRLVATNSAGGTSASEDETFTTTQPPAIDGLASENLTATSADLNAQINPNGLQTTYRFEYGASTSYGQSAPVPDGTLSPLYSDQPVGVHLTNLVPHVVYHYRLVAINVDGTTNSDDHTFNFYPPSCPNENVRQQVQANFLPDCRAYELVSPADAGGTQLYPGGPNTGYATSPSRLSFTGLWSIIPNSGGDPIDSAGDLYVATRTDSGWVTRYVGLPAKTTAVDGGPPMGLPASAPRPQKGGSNFEPAQSFGGDAPDKIQNNVLTDPQMNAFVNWNDGNQAIGGFAGADAANPTPTASNSAYVWNADGSFNDRWPTNLAAVPDGVYPPGSNFHHVVEIEAGEPPEHIAHGGMHALDCVSTKWALGTSSNFCPGDVTASSDLSHFVFVTEWNLFATGGQLSAPGSVYDNDTVNGTTAVASKTPNGENIPSEVGDPTGEPLQTPAVSSDGSHILIAAEGTGPCGTPTCPEGPPGGDFFRVAVRAPLQASHLYMRVGGHITYDVSEGHDVNYVGMTSDGSKVYFTSGDRITGDDHDTSTDLFMWSEGTDSITRLSTGSSGTGNSDSCDGSFSAKCGVETFDDSAYCSLLGGVGGNCRSDGSIATDAGDIYFFSPELLDGSLGIPNQENVYVYHGGHAQYVTTLTTKPFCYQTPAIGISNNACAETPLTRMEVTPDGSHAAFITDSPITQYDNAGHLEMYTYNPESRVVICVSCRPDGAPPAHDVTGSQDGLFLANDGRAFFATEDALVHIDTNRSLDVYEYVDGHAQLITPGTGDTSVAGGGGTLTGTYNPPGLIGVSADGRDAYFSTLETLVRQDHNGLFLKMYDARAGGGFPAPAPPPPCSAADECHGTGSEPPAALQNGSGAALTGGKVVPSKPHKKKNRRKRHRRHKAHRAGTRRGGNGVGSR